MAQTNKKIRDAYNAKTYKQYAFRVRRKSELYEKLEEAASNKQASVNWIVCKLLSDYYEVPMPEAHNDLD
jgi:predicted HicB family RNase H-like nuclease